MKKIVFAFLLLFAQQAFANPVCDVESVVISPEPLYSDEAGHVWVRGGCAQGAPPSGVFVDVEGFDITVRIDADGSGPLVPLSWGERFKLPQLRPGRYTMRFFNEGTQLRTQQFDVLARPFRITPQFGARGTEVMLTGLPDDDCQGVCAPWRVLFGGAPATNLRVTADGLIATVPSGAHSGDVLVQMPDGRQIHFDNAFRFADDAADQWDRVLFPVNFTGRGAHGSEWHTDIVIRNDAPITVDTHPLFWADPESPVLPPLTQIAPGGRGNFPEEPRDGGRFLYVPRGLEASFSYASHVVDRSRSATDLGTEMPVVRVEDTGRAVRFLEIPVDAQYRAKLRVYDFDGTNEHTVRVTIRRRGSNDVMFSRNLDLTGAEICGGVSPCFPSRPSFAYLDLDQLPQLRGLGVVDVWVNATRNDARIWAFVSITNNETQSVTLHTPQHEPAK